MISGSLARVGSWARSTTLTAACSWPLLVSSVACRSERARSDRTEAAAREDAPALRPPPPTVAGDFELDGFQLGDVFAEAVKIRGLYTSPCEIAHLGESQRRLIMYGPRRCARGRFPENTVAAFFLPYRGTRGAARDEEPIAAFAWFGGPWFTDRSDFPLYVGDPDTSASATLGPPRHIFELHRSRSRRTLIVRGHPGDLWSLSDGVALVGFVVGPMPSSAKNEQWQTLLRFYETHGPKR